MKWVFLFTSLLWLTACGTSPEPDFYDMKAIDGIQTDNNFAIKIQRPTIPDYLDRPDIVREENAYQYQIDEMHRWAEPLDRMFERVLTEDLRQRLPNSTILSEDDTGAANLRTIINTNITECNAVNGQEASFKAQLSIADKNGNQIFKPQIIELKETYTGSYETLAAALSRLTASYADTIVLNLKNRPAAAH